MKLNETFVFDHLDRTKVNFDHEHTKRIIKNIASIKTVVVASILSASCFGGDEFTTAENVGGNSGEGNGTNVGVAGLASGGSNNSGGRLVNSGGMETGGTSGDGGTGGMETGGTGSNSSECTGPVTLKVSRTRKNSSYNNVRYFVSLPDTEGGFGTTVDFSYPGAGSGLDFMDVITHAQGFVELEGTRLIVQAYDPIADNHEVCFSVEDNKGDTCRIDGYGKPIDFVTAMNLSQAQWYLDNYESNLVDYEKFSNMDSDQSRGTACVEIHCDSSTSCNSGIYILWVTDN
ncbi:hypothetical protein GF376_01230 [Candidatus Peregrinibacteria bacterium]|nr:hypothetical protein [Candidatus Peregrinibacteria bacterium]